MSATSWSRSRSAATPRRRASQTRLLTRLRGGESFVALARAVSDDLANKDQGGDLGWVRRGATVPAFERAAFALTKTQPLSSLVRTQFGYHLIQLVERREGKVPPLEDVRVSIGQTLAAQYGDTLARLGAERILREAKDYDDLLAKAERASSEASSSAGTRARRSTAQPRSTCCAPMPRTPHRRRCSRASTSGGQGYVVAALDTVPPPRPLSFEESQDRALQEKQRERGIVAARARADRIESDLKPGVPWEQAIETAGGEAETQPMPRGVGLPTLGVIQGSTGSSMGRARGTIAVGGWRRLATPRGDLCVQLLVQHAAPAAHDWRRCAPPRGRPQPPHVRLHRAPALARRGHRAARGPGRALPPPPRR